LRLFATASQFRPTQRFQLTTITDVAISTGDCAFGLQLDQRFWHKFPLAFALDSSISSPTDLSHILSFDIGLRRLRNLRFAVSSIPIVFFACRSYVYGYYSSIANADYFRPLDSMRRPLVHLQKLSSLCDLIRRLFCLYGFYRTLLMLCVN
jgi:hypothetical protein